MGRLEELLIGRAMAGRYSIEAVLGRGGMGVVYRATDVRLQRAVALKVLSPPVGADTDPENLRARFRREARAAASIHHPCVVTVYDYGTDPELDLDYLVMELLAGDDLAALLSHGPQRPSLDRALEILYEAATGLAAGHRQGIVHRDVKPANIFLVGEGRGTPGVRLLDFGIAQDWSREGTVTRLTEFGRVPLTPLYASPEQAGGRSELTPASDVYSLGMTALAMLSQEEPRNRLLQGEDSPLRFAGAALPPQLERILTRALNPDPRQRFPDGSTLAEALDLLRSGRTASPGASQGSGPSSPVVVDRHDMLPVHPAATAPGPFARRGPRRGSGTPVGAIVGVVTAIGVGGAAILFLQGASRAGEGEARPGAGPDSNPVQVTPGNIVQQQVPPVRPWPSLTAEEEQHVEAERRAGMDEVEALLRLSVEKSTTCEFGGGRDACDRSREIDAYLEERGLIRLPDPEVQERVIRENLSLVQDIQDARISMQILYPKLHVSSEASIESYPARAFVSEGNLFKAVADFRLQMPEGSPVRIVEEFYYDAGGQLVYVRRRVWTGGPEPVEQEVYHFRGGALVHASWNDQPSPRSSPALQLDAMLVHRRGEAVRGGVHEGRENILVSIDDLYPTVE